MCGRVVCAWFGTLFLTANSLAGQAGPDDRLLGEARGILYEAREAALLVPDAKEISSLVHNMVGSQARAGDLRGAFETAHIFRQRGSSDSAFGAIAYHLAFRGDVVSAKLAVAWMGESNEKASAWFWMAVALADSGRRDAAVALARQIPFNDTRINALEAVARKQIAAGEAEDARQTLTLAWEFARTYVGPAERDFAVDHVSMIAKIGTTQLLAGDHTGASVAYELVEQILAAHAGSQKLQPSLLYVTLQQVRGNIQLAQQTAMRIKDPAGRDAVYRAIARRLAETGNIEEARARIQQIQNYERIHAVQEVAMTQASGGDWLGAIDTARLMNGRKQQGEALLAIAFSLTWTDQRQAAANLLHEAMDFFEQSMDALDSKGLARVAAVQSKIGNFAEGWRIALTIKEPVERQDALYRVAFFEVESGDYRSALRQARELREPKERADVLYGIADAILDVLEAAKRNK